MREAPAEIVVTLDNGSVAVGWLTQSCVEIRMCFYELAWVAPK